MLNPTSLESLVSGDADPEPAEPDGLDDFEWRTAAQAARRLRRFGPASEEPYRRRTTDALRVALAVVVVTLIARTVGHVSPAQEAIRRFFLRLPRSEGHLAQVLEHAASLWVVALVIGASLLARRWRLARDLVIAGALAWLVARGLGLGLGGELKGHYGAVLRTRQTPAFPDVRVTLVAAVLRTSVPYVGAATRRIGLAFMLVLLPCELYLGVAIPRDLIAGLVLGYGVGAAVHLALGSPGGRPTAEQVQASLADLGVQARAVRLAPEQPGGATLMLARDEKGQLELTVLGRDETDARVLAKIWRSVVYRDGGPRVFLSRAQQVEHQAYVHLLAADRGARVPRVAGAGVGGPKAAVLALRPPEGVSLAETDPGLVTDEVLVDVWRQLVALRSAAIAHGRLTTRHVVLGADGPVLTSFDAATTQADAAELSADVAELLATTAALVGIERAMGAAGAVLDDQALADALPLLQPLALSREGRSLVGSGRREQRDQLVALRTEVARRLGVEAPALVQIRRISGRSLALAVGTLIGVGGLLGQVSDPSTLAEVIESSRPGYVLLALVLAALSAVGYAVAFAGSVPQRLPIWSNLKLQLAGPFANLALPIGAQALQVRYLQQQGMAAGSAVAATGVVNTGLGAVLQGIVFVIAQSLSPRPLHLSLLPQGVLPELLLGLAVALVLVSVAVAVAGPLRRWLRREVSRAAVTIFAVLRSPRLLFLQVLGNLLVSFSFGLSLAACLSAYGQSLPLSTLLAINIAITTIAAIVPIPGGGTAVGTVGLTGAMVALGIATAPAVGVVLLSQLATSYVPAVPGWFVLRSMLAKEEI